MNANQFLVTYRGYKLPANVVEDIKRATKAWKDRDKNAWEFARHASSVVGRYIPEATKALARNMGTSSPSTPEGYAKAWELRIDLHKHRKPFFNELYISHYIVVGKSYGAGKIDLEEAFEVLQICVREELSVEALRGILSGRMGGDDWATSAASLKEQIQKKIIEAPFTGVDEMKAAVAAMGGRAFLRLLDWALTGSKPAEQVRPDVEHFAEHVEAIVEEDQGHRTFVPSQT